MRARLGASFGPVCGIVLAALIFALSHGHFYSGDPVVQAIGACGFFAALVFGWATLRTGSVLPDLISGRAHFYVNPMLAMITQIQAGRIRLLAVTSPKRVSPGITLLL